MLRWRPLDRGAAAVTYHMSSIKRLAPVLFLIVAIPCLVGITVHRLLTHPWPPHWLTLGLVGLYFGWLLAEARITVREPKKEEATDDRSSLELYAAARCVTVLGTVLSPPMDGTVSMRWVLLAAGVTIMIFGMGLRLAAIRKLAGTYSHSVRIPSDGIIVGGVYRYLRHPAYAGMVLGNLGFVVAFASQIGMAALLGLLLPAVTYRILIEESLLLLTLQEYREFAKTRKRLVPFIW